jgi:hypothetical protein
LWVMIKYEAEINFMILTDEDEHATAILSLLWIVGTIFIDMYEPPLRLIFYCYVKLTILYFRNLNVFQWDYH